MKKSTLVFVGLGGALAVALAAWWYYAQRMCLPVWQEHGITIARCPDGDMKQRFKLDATGVRRGGVFDVSVGATAVYTEGIADETRGVSLPDVQVRSLALVVDGNERQLSPEVEDGNKPWQRRGVGVHARVSMPKDVPDGEHLLRAKVKTTLGEDTIEAKVRLFAPARVHVLADRPLYEPGNLIRYRAIVLRARDLVPLGGRPGTWKIKNPRGEVVLEERAPADDFGVTAGDFPLDDGAPEGRWEIQWQSADARGATTVRVEPFTLPRFVVEATPHKTFYEAGDAPRVDGKVTYSSGAPVEAAVEIRWSVDGSWPAPPLWLSERKGSLPRRASTDREGRFTLDLPKIPKDVRGKVTLVGTVVATDPAGDRVTGAVRVLLAEDAIDVSAVTEMSGDRLVEGVNNRVYLRATTADGTVLPGATLLVKRAWDPTDEGTEVETDEDGVASVQVDPGPPVNIVVPPMPVRPPKRPDPVVRTSARELIQSREPTLKELTSMDGWNEALAPCARFVERGSRDVEVSLRVASTGQIIGVGAEGELGRCVARVLRQQGVSYSEERIFKVSWRFTSDMASLDADVGGTDSLPDPVQRALDRALLDARDCIGDDSTEGSLPRMWLWSVQGRRFSARAVPDDNVRDAVDGGVARCIEDRLVRVADSRTLTESEAPGTDAFGWIRLDVEPAPRVQARRPQATTFLGYELAVSATSDEEEIGDTKVRFRPGEIPPLRLRADPVLPEPGAKVAVKLLRGPSFRGDLPKKLFLVHEAERLEAELDDKEKAATFELPKDAEGWWTVSHAGATARVYVRGGADLAVAVEPDRKTYKPREQAQLAVTTTSGGKPVVASVTLAGVDETLGQLAALPGAGELRELRAAASGRQAFGVLEAVALEQGRIRGDNAAAATVLGVTSIPSKPELDVTVSASAETPFDPVEPLTDHFYVVLGELYDQVGRWEESAPEDEKMTPARMAKLWDESIATCDKRGDDVTDIFGRPLTLKRLPDDLLALAAPRAVVVEGTRLPEDMENWLDWVRSSKP